MTEIGLGFQSNKLPRDYEQLARLAEDGGVDVLTVFHDLFFQPALFPLLEMARATKRVRLGPACLNPYTLAPHEIAGQIAALDIASSGRAYLGLARGSWLADVGIDQPHPLDRVREAVDVIYMLLAGDEGGYKGEVFTLAPRTRLNYAVIRPDPPLLIGAWGAQTLTYAGGVASEVKIGGSANPDLVSWVRRRLDEGADQASRREGRAGIVLGAVTVVDDDGAEARRRARREVAMYLDVMAGLDPTFTVPEEVAQAVRREVASGNHEGAAASIPDEVLERFAFAGTPGQVAGRAQELFEAGADRVEFGTPHGLTDFDGVQAIVDRVLPALR